MNIFEKGQLKESYKYIIFDLEKQIQEILKDKKYVYKDKPCLLFKKTEDERLLDIKNYMDEFEKNPLIGLPYFVRNQSLKIEEYISKIGFGHMSEFVFEVKSENIGWFNIELFLSLSVARSEKEKLEQEIQLKILDSMNISYVCNNSLNHYEFKDCDSNIDIIKKTLKDMFFAKNISILCEFDCIQKVSFKILAKNMVNISEFKDSDFSKLYKEEKIDKEILSIDEVTDLHKNLDEMKTVLSMSEYLDKSEKTDTIGNILQYCFCNMCDILNIETETSKAILKRHEDVRNKNFQIRDIENILGEEFKKLKSNEVIDLLDDYLKNLNIKFQQSFGFILDIIEIGRYENIRIKAKYLQCPFVKDWCIEEKDITLKYETTDGSFKNENLYIFNNTKNISTISNLICFDFNGELLDLKLKHLDFEKFSISGFTFSVPKL